MRVESEWLAHPRARLASLPCLDSPSGVRSGARSLSPLPIICRQIRSRRCPLRHRLCRPAPGWLDSAAPCSAPGARRLLPGAAERRGGRCGGVSSASAGPVLDSAYCSMQRALGVHRHARLAWRQHRSHKRCADIFRQILPDPARSCLILPESRQILPSSCQILLESRHILPDDARSCQILQDPARISPDPAQILRRACP